MDIFGYYGYFINKTFYIISLSLICHGENPETVPFEPILIISSGSFILLNSGINK